MTQRQIIAAEETLPNFFEKHTSEQCQLRKELSCRYMIDSCLVYGVSTNFYDPETKQFGPYAENHVKKLGEKTVLRLYNEQTEDFSKAIVHHGVYTDYEGCAYNSCTWADEQ